MFSLSPDGTLLLVPLAASQSDPGAAQADTPASLVAGLGRTVLYELGTGAVRSTRVNERALAPIAERRPDLFLAAACWSADGDSVHLGGGDGEALALAVGNPQPEWRVVADGAGECPRSGRRGEQLLGRHGPFVVERSAGGLRVRAAAEPQWILLEYEGRLMSPDVTVADLALSPDGGRLAIVLARGQGSFSGPSELFVISVAAREPAARSLGGPAFDVRWTPNGASLLAGSRLPGSADHAIYRWDM